MDGSSVSIPNAASSAGSSGSSNTASGISSSTGSGSTSNGTSMMSEAMRDGVEQYQRMRQTLDEKHLRSQLIIPTDDGEVCLRLRSLSEPICYFGEDASDRRDRLRGILAKRISQGLPIPQWKKDKRQLAVDLGQLTERINERRPYFSEGRDGLRECRRGIADWSLSRARARIEHQKRAREQSLSPSAMRAEHVATQAYLSSYSVQGSMLGVSQRPLCCIRISSNGRWVSMGCVGGSVSVWSLPSLDCHSSIIKQNSDDERMENNDNTKDDDGRPLSLSRDPGMKCLHRSVAHRDRVTSVDWYPLKEDLDANMDIYLSSGADRTIALHKRGKVTSRIDCNKDDIHRQRLGQCRFHGEGRYLISTSWDRSWGMWDIERSRCVIRQEGHSKEVHCLAMHPDGSLLTTGDLGGVLRVWDLRSGRAVMGLDSHMKGVLCCDFSSNGFTIASGAMDHAVKVWDIRKRSESTIAAHHNNVCSVRFGCFRKGAMRRLSDAGRWQVKSEEDSSVLTTMDSKISSKMMNEKDRFGCNAVCSSFLMTASFDRCIKVWSAVDNTLVHTLLGHESRIADADVSPDGSFIVSAAHDKTWKLWYSDRMSDPLLSEDIVIHGDSMYQSEKMMNMNMKDEHSGIKVKQEEPDVSDASLRGWNDTIDVTMDDETVTVDTTSTLAGAMMVDDTNDEDRVLLGSDADTTDSETDPL